jgi:predicted GIY-YIG superfamily endonuclease
MKGVHIVRGHGKEYCYAWRGGPRIMSKMGTKAFDAELGRAKATPKSQRAEYKTPLKEPNIGNRIQLDSDKNPDLTHLYRHYGFDGKLLYVGITKSTLGRWGEHTRRGDRRSIWTDEVALITVDHYPTREDAEAAEAAVILAERPTFNRVVRIAKKLAA